MIELVQITCGTMTLKTPAYFYTNYKDDRGFEMKSHIENEPEAFTMMLRWLLHTENVFHDIG